ncbi:MAG: LysR family transcriptional regulator [Clostridia bacterium]|nr:LysR family transcriptional regulator [Clostridia bacterium]
MITQKHMNIVLTVVREGSFTAASKKLFISQPALSQTIKQVESELGATLFNRLTTPVELTHAGRLFVDYANQILLIDQNLHTRLAAAKGEISEHFSFGVSSQRSLHLMPKVIPEFCRRNPNVRITLMEDVSSSLERLVLDGRCDLAMVSTNNKRNRLIYRLIENEHIVLLAARDTDLAKTVPNGTPISLLLAVGENFISMNPEHPVRIIQNRLFERYAMSPNIILETHNMETARRLTALTRTVFLMPDSYLPDTLTPDYPLNVYPLDDPDNLHPLYLCYREGHALSEIENDLLQIICNRLGASLP